MSSLPVFARKKEAAGDKTVQRLVTVSDCDDLSLVSDQNSVKYSVTSSGVVKDEKASCSPRSPKQTVPDFHLKREISNLSLSNYLKAVPTPSSQEQDSLPSPSQI